MKLLLCILSLICASCSDTILVVDESGMPIEGAQVRPMSRGFDWPSTLTNAKGGAFVHQDVPTIDFVRISKDGYRPHPPVNFELPKPITVVLQR